MIFFGESGVCVDGWSRVCQPVDHGSCPVLSSSLQAYGTFQLADPNFTGPCPSLPPASDWHPAIVNTIKMSANRIISPGKPVMSRLLGVTLQ